MTENTQFLLLALAILQIKHFICDFLIQSPYQYLNKGKYGHPGGLIHAGLHAATTMFVFILITPPLAVGAAIVLAEFVVHYHIDWMKEQTVRRQRWQFPQAEFWWAFGFDQFLHQFTYLAIVAVLAAVNGL